MLPRPSELAMSKPLFLLRTSVGVSAAPPVQRPGRAPSNAGLANAPTTPPTCSSYPWGTVLLASLIAFVVGGNAGYSFFEKHGTT